ncbi:MULTISPECIES: hypothetical protein [unclassified Colwellia]|uniref:hypothetical protein n=1 Tax=unclassified Colwellia TaxID=196834 RepID=UPI0015F35F12|nr:MULTISPECIES: hypothetical protein [unclassified Colwellia]MBA6233484.1 hypothetical protein [Colwellia sp. MB02u-7]MBA6236574.1 hypothetical protein [Colwellia sp. MB02u-11]MBA6298027.1 hypothetical protein [Colwellia sp. MB3u-22]MBA6312149.1 hypothetical protein [Colwellia sp. MB3u-64]
MTNKWIKKGFVFAHNEDCKSDWWQSHTMAPSAIQLNNGSLRIYFGAWDSKKISSITYIDVDSSDPRKVLYVEKTTPVLTFGEDGMFDENGVFPGHAYNHEGEIYLYYTGFQLGHKVRHYNFGGLALSSDGTNFIRTSQAPILDRAEEGLYVRAGQSTLVEKGKFHNVYSAGSGWFNLAGEDRPVYDVFYQNNNDGKTMADKGNKIVECDFTKEHGLGRPQITKIGDDYYTFYTRRTVDFKYFIGCSKSKDLVTWVRADDEFSFTHSNTGFDSEMIYFPSVVYAKDVDKYYLFYSGNYFGRDGIGFAELVRE